MYGYLGNNLNSDKELVNSGNIEYLRLQCLKKILQRVDIISHNKEQIETQNLNATFSQIRLNQTAKKAKIILFKEVKKHPKKSESIEPWKIPINYFTTYAKTLNVNIQQAPLKQLYIVMKLAHIEASLSSRATSKYAEKFAPSHLVKVIGTFLGVLKQKYKQQHNRLIGFVNMHFHYTSPILLQILSHAEQNLLSAYFKVIDDRLYISLQCANTAVSQLDCDSVTLMAVEPLLLISNNITKSITKRIIEKYPACYSYSGRLNNKKVIIYSIRDLEMFQAYLWIYADRRNIAAIQQKLFLFYVMLYPTLKVSCEIIRQMLHLFRQEISERLNTEQANTLMSYFPVIQAYVFC